MSTPHPAQNLFAEVQQLNRAYVAINGLAEPPPIVHPTIDDSVRFAVLSKRARDLIATLRDAEWIAGGEKNEFDATAEAAARELVAYCESQAEAVENMTGQVLRLTTNLRATEEELAQASQNRTDAEQAMLMERAHNDKLAAENAFLHTTVNQLRGQISQARTTLNR